MRKETGEFGEKNLIDRYRLMIHPILLGGGARLFAEGSNETVLSLAGSTRTFKSGIVVLEHERSRR
jgi:dihydrofolate reductase